MTCGVIASSLHADTCYQNDCCYDEEYCCENGWNFYADWIYWRTRNCKLDYAIPYESEENSIGKVYSPDLGYDSGFRVGASSSCNCWNYGLEYTRYSSTADGSYKNSDGHIAGTHILDDYTEVSQGSDIVLAKSDWKLDYNVIDLSMGKTLTMGDCATMNVFGGLKFAYINQDFKNVYSDNLDFSLADRDVSIQKHCMDGYGISLGFAPEYKLSNCFSFVGAFSYDSYVSKYDRSFKYITYDTTTSESGTSTIEETVVNLSDECWGSVSTLNLAVALKYSMSGLFCSCGDLSLTVGYEFHNWLNFEGLLEHQNESDEITFDRYNQGLGFDGLFVRLSATF